MTNNVTNLFGKDGDQTFIICPCTEEGTPVIPVVIHGTSGPIIASLMCPDCDKVIPVVNGILQIGVDV
uniref:Uncharacterized protein n=1 Tax=Marinobacter nauticus TaxID=2743 RepID=A0A455W6U1_MARNT|nr:hypothetical protein YBY_30350 [Marinobacter nauticus]